MTEARADILAAVTSAAAARRARNGAAPAVADHLRPGRASGEGAALVARFCDMAEFAGATVAHVATAAEAPAAVAAFISRAQLGDSLVLSPEPWLAALPWQGCLRLVLRRGAPEAGDRVAVTGAVAGVAETGTLLVRSGADIPNALHLLPDAHVALLPAVAIVGSYEDALARLAQTGPLPRAATFITGPSRTADIEKTPQIGVHGPRRLHVVVIDGA